MGEQFWGIFRGGVAGGVFYLAAATQSPRVAQELANELDEELFREAWAGYEEFGDTPQPDWDDFEGLHFVEPISQELADDTADELAEGLIVQVELPSRGLPRRVD